MSNDIHCPLCDSTDVTTQFIIENISEPFAGDPEEVKLSENICNNCGISGDFLGLNDKTLEEIFDSLKSKSAISILSDFSKVGLNFSSVERALELPQRTLTKWKAKGKPSAAGLALLRFLRLFPWLIEVADQRFDFQKSQTICTKAVFNAALKKVVFNDAFIGHQESTTGTNNFFQQININCTLGSPTSLVAIPGDPVFSR